MGVLFLTPTWAAPSEVWIARQIAALEPDVLAVGTCEPAQRFWEGRIPALRLLPAAQSAWGRRWRRWAGRGGAAKMADVVAARLARGDVQCVLVHYLDFALKLASAWAASDVPVFVHPHGFDTEWDIRRWNAPDEPRFDEAYFAAIRALSQRAILIANSALVRERLLAIGVTPQRIVLQYYGIPIPPPPAATRPKDETEVLYLGRLIDCKGPELTIRAFERACNQGFRGRLTMAGDGWLRPTCELLRRRSPYAERMRLLGAVTADQAVKLRADADIFTAHNCRGPLTRQEESFGVAVVEAMGAGVPVVTGASGGVRETVISGETGILFEPGDVAGHAAALVRLGADPALRERMGAAAQRRAREMFDPARRWNELRRLLGLPVRSSASSSAAPEQDPVAAPA